MRYMNFFMPDFAQRLLNPVYGCFRNLPPDCQDRTAMFRILYLTALLPALLFVSPQVMGQQFYSGMLPQASLSYRWSDNIQQAIKVELMHEMYSPENKGFGYTYDHTDIQMFLQGRLNPFTRIAVGYQYRFEGSGENMHRYIQQVSILRRGGSYRLGHRVRTDQSLYVSDPLKLRLRYRLSAEFPLEGQSVDAGEIYMVTSGEPVYSIQGSVSDLETRFVGSIGYYINTKAKLEAGLDYRLEKILVRPFRQKLWLTVGWFYSM